MEGILNLENCKSVSLEREYLAKDLPVQELLTITNKDMNDNINNI